jgi:hypothetical protein
MAAPSTFGLSLVLMFAFGLPLPAATGPDDPFARALDERMAALLAKYRVPGSVVSGITNGDVAWTKAFGLANLKCSAFPPGQMASRMPFDRPATLK